VTDDELIEPRTVTVSRDLGDGTWACTLSCGHELIFIVQPPVTGGTLLHCAQCIDILLERHRECRD